MRNRFDDMLDALGVGRYSDISIGSRWQEPM